MTRSSRIAKRLGGVSLLMMTLTLLILALPLSFVIPFFMLRALDKMYKARLAYSLNINQFQYPLKWRKSLPSIVAFCFTDPAFMPRTHYAPILCIPCERGGDFNIKNDKLVHTYTHKIRRRRINLEKS